jgi:AhpD family alkylhydroperoxidase
MYYMSFHLSIFQERHWYTRKGTDMDNEPTIEINRVDSSGHEGLTKLSRLGADTFGYKADLSVDRQLAQLLRLRVAQINNCTYCLNLHYEAARNLDTPRPKIDTLTAWWETNLFSPAERAALAYTEALTRIDAAAVDSQFKPYHDDLADHFRPDQILDIIGIVINMNIWTRLKLAEGAMPTLAAEG